MKILMISHEYPPVGGGGANACMHLAAEYTKAGCDVTVLSVYYPGLLEEETVEVDIPGRIIESVAFEDTSDSTGISKSYKIIRIKAKRKHKEHCGFPEMLDFMFKAISRSCALVKESSFDICQIFFAIPAGPVGYVLKKRFGLPYIIRFGGGDIPGFQDRFAFVYKLLGPFEKVIWKEAKALVANSAGLKKLAEDFYDKKEILVIPNGVDPDAFSVKTQHKINDPSFKILFVSRLIERKGLQFVIPDLKNVKGDYKLIIVGDGPYRPELERIVAENGLKEQVIFEGQKDKADLPSYYKDADLFILPSKKEGMPNVVLEAMSCGLPVLMTPCQGSDELIDGNGYVLKTEDFVNKINELMKDRALCKKLGNRSRELIEERFLWSKTAESYLKIM